MLTHRAQAAELFSNPLTSALVSRCVLKHSNISSAMASILSTKVKYTDLPGAFERTGDGGSRDELAAHEEALRSTFEEVLSQPDALRAITADLVKCFIVDPAADGVLQPALFFKGAPRLRAGDAGISVDRTMVHAVRRSPEDSPTPRRGRSCTRRSWTLRGRCVAVTCRRLPCARHGRSKRSSTRRRAHACTHARHSGLRLTSSGRR